MHKVTYRPDIDGMRAVAVISVVFYHAWPSVLPGGLLELTSFGNFRILDFFNYCPGSKGWYVSIREFLCPQDKENFSSAHFGTHYLPGRWLLAVTCR